MVSIPFEGFGQSNRWVTRLKTRLFEAPNEINYPSPLKKIRG
jgi:hypothetical protein